MAGPDDVVADGAVKQPECGSLRKLFGMCAGPDPDMLGSGMAHDAAEKLMTHNQRIDAALNEALGVQAPPPKL